MSDAYANVLQYFNAAFTCAFAVEAVVKLAGFGLCVSCHLLNNALMFVFVFVCMSVALAHACCYPIIYITLQTSVEIN